MIIVSGATGKLGSRIVDRLLSRVPASTVGVSVTDVARAAHLEARGVRVRRGDFTDPTTLAGAFEGAEQVLLVSAAIAGEGGATANITAVDAALAAGAGRVLYTSHQGSSATSLFPAMITHARTEEHLAATGIPYLALRNGFYSSTLDLYLEQALATGWLVAPEDGPVSWTGHDDLATAAAALLTGDDSGVTAPLTAPETLDLTAVAAILSEITGREITRVVAGDQEWVEATVTRGVPRAYAEFGLGVFRASRRGEFAVTGPTLEKLIGGPAESVRTKLEGALAGA
jgi:NAD(P)H dehydrogenase (quinone)